MRILIATHAGAGHVFPLQRLGARLHADGHAVTLLSADETAAGRHYATIEPTPSGPFEDNFPAYEAIFFGPALAAEVRDVAQAERADVVMTDALIPAALCGAHASDARAVTVLNLPYARLRRELLSGTGWWSQQLPGLNATRRTLGLSPYVRALESFECATRMLVLGIPDLEEPDVELPEHLVFTGPGLPLPDAVNGPARRPLVVVSLSSSQMRRQHDTLQTILDGLGRLDVDVIASTARMVACDELDVPPNCHLHDWLPQPEVFAGSAAVVTHAGHGTVMAALAAGAPLVCVPLGRDQPSTAARLASLGAGLVATPATVRAAVATVLADDSYRAVARRLRATLASLDRAVSAALPRVPPR